MLHFLRKEDAMDKLSRAPTYDEDPAYYEYSRVMYIDELQARHDYSALMSCRKPSLSEYDEKQ
jgi:hypothetical protein